MNPNLKTWLKTARANLVPEAQRLVSEQILEHFLNAVERYQLEGKSILEAEAKALADLGDSCLAAKKFEQSYLTYAELEECAKPRDKAVTNGYSLSLIALITGSLSIYFSLQANSFSWFIGIFTIGVGLYTGLSAYVARHYSLKIYVLYGWIAGASVVPLYAYFVFEQYQKLPIRLPFTNYVPLGLVLLTIWTIWQLPRCISSWRKLSMLRGAL